MILANTGENMRYQVVRKIREERQRAPTKFQSPVLLVKNKKILKTRKKKKKLKREYWIWKNLRLGRKVISCLSRIS